MSKKHKKNNLLDAAAAAKPNAADGQGVNSGEAAAPEPIVEQPSETQSVPAAPEAPAETVTSEREPTDEQAQAAPAAEAAPAEGAEAPKEEAEIPQPEIPDAPPQEEPKEKVEQEAPKDAPPPPPPAPGPTVVKEAPVQVPPTPRKIVMSSDLLPKPRNPIQARRESPAKLPPGAVRLIQLFDDYEKVMTTPSDDARECERRVKKLYELMNTACSVVNIKSEPATNAMIKIVFDRLMKGWGKYYSEKTMFKRDYTLNNTAQIDRFNAFWVAMMQLVQAATEGTRVSFDPRALMDVIKNETVTKVIVRFRDAIVERNEIEASSKPL